METKYPADPEVKGDAAKSSNDHMIVEKYKRKEAPSVDPKLEVPRKSQISLKLHQLNR